MESEIVMGIKETKGSCSPRTGFYCFSWQMRSLPPSARKPLLPSASQPANTASCLLYDSVGGNQAIHVTDLVHYGFAKTMPDQGLLQVVAGK